MANFLLAHIPFPTIPRYLTSYVPRETPLSTTPSVLTALASYLAVIFGVQAVMKNRRAHKLTILFRAHNMFLSAGSLVLLVLMLEEIIPIAWRNGVFSVMCAEESWTKRLEFYYMINYSFKYIELFDTIFLAFRKKPLPFLHVFHHSATALLCYSQLNGKTSVSWVVITLNLAVHVLMYYYYYATAAGAKIWWKKYLTIMQITQFIIDLFVVYFGTYEHYAATYFDGTFRHHGNCAGTETAALFGCGLITIYLCLFINFYIQTYKKPVQLLYPAVNGSGFANGNEHKHH